MDFWTVAFVGARTVAAELETEGRLDAVDPQQKFRHGPNSASQLSGNCWLAGDCPKPGTSMAKVICSWWTITYYPAFFTSKQYRLVS